MPLRVKKTKESGVLLAVSSLASNHGIGTIGKAAYEFIDFLKISNQRYWQILPLNPLDRANSPYKSSCTLAGEILYIDLDFLVLDRLLLPHEIPKREFSGNVDYAAVREFKLPLLKLAAERFDTKNKEYRRFLKENQDWLCDYALFSAAKKVYKTDSLQGFPDSIKYRLPYALESFADDHKNLIDFFKITQFLFFKQYFALKKYATQNGIKIIGDIPFYVSPDSVDVWVSPDNFKVGRDFTPTLVAGVPPDIFSLDGQLWGNPIYNWDYMKKDSYSWWKKRLSKCKEMFDVIRIDHFRAFADYYSIPQGSPTAKSGRWEKGVGAQFFDEIEKDLGKINIIAEDLGGEDEISVINLLKQTEFPNMKVLQFAFNTDRQNPFLPENYNENCICYSGTHDNDTALGWFNTASREEKIMFLKLAQNEELPIPHRMIRLAVNSKANIVIIPFQDLLCLDSKGRLNTPGTDKGNWEWRMGKDDNNIENAMLLKNLTLGRN